MSCMYYLYVVFRTGTYRKECIGVFSSENEAKEIAIRLVEDEPDDWHTLEVKKFFLDEVTPKNKLQCKKGAMYEDPLPIFSISKKVDK